MKEQGKGKEATEICKVCGNRKFKDSSSCDVCDWPIGFVRKVPTKMRHKPLITLKLNNMLINVPCAICGGRCDPGGFDYCMEGTGRLVCDPCAAKYAPEMVKIKEAAEAYAERDVEIVAEDIRLKIYACIDQPLEDRIKKVLDEICKINDAPF